MKPHPCLSCGACCAFFRVQFPKEETYPTSFGVPADLTRVFLNEDLVMQGTLQDRPRCVALGGKIGVSVACKIYETRPGCCRRFTASFEDGFRNSRCDKARMAKGLKPLSPSDYEDHRPSTEA